MGFVRIRHFTAQDIPARSELLRDADFQANLTDFAALAGQDVLAAGQLRTIAEEQQTKRIFTACRRRDGGVIGFLWITEIDWRSQRCELSFALLPQFRGGLGPPTIDAAREYIYEELNLTVLVDQVLDHNTMLHSDAELAKRSRVRCPYDSYTVGRWRTACFWTQTVEQFHAARERDARLRAERSTRIRATLERGAGPGAAP